MSFDTLRMILRQAQDERFKTVVVVSPRPGVLRMVFDAAVRARRSLAAMPDASAAPGAVPLGPRRVSIDRTRVLSSICDFF